MKSNQTNGKMLFPTGRTAIVALGLLAGMALGSQPIVAAEVTSPVVAQQQQAKGKVVDKSGEPLIGVTVQVVGQTGGTVTDIDGKYTIDAQKGAKLKFSYVGYKDQTIAYDGAPVNITMSEGEEMLQELVVVGYGTQKKESLTGAVTVVDSKAFQEKGGLSSPLQALQGQVPGVMITRSSSAPGDESWSMNLRGASSMNSTEPLVIIDGVACNSVNDMRLLNSNDIESINFLKDGSAAIYGSRAAGGVVLITTKKGKEGRLKIEYGGSTTLKTVGLMPEICNIDQWADGVMQALENDGNTSNVWYTYAQLAKKYKNTYIDLQKTTNPFGGAAFTDVKDFVFDDSVDWLGSLFGSSWSTDQNLSISGGTDKNSYRISLNYLYDGSPLQYGDNNNQRYNARFNNTYKFNKIFSLESSIAYSRQEQVAPTLISAALTTSLPMPGLPLRASNGKPYAWGTWGSPVSKVEEGGDNKLSVSTINISETLKAHITPWLDANVNLGYNTSDARRRKIQNAITYYNYNGTTQTLQDPTQAKSYFEQTSSRTDFYSISGYLNAHKTFAKVHNTSLTLGSQYELKDMEYFGANYTDILDGLDVINGNGTLTLVDGSNYNYRTANMSYFGRLNYDFDSRYLLELNGRYDGSSKFQKKNRWDFFWGASAGWRINQEAFLKDVKWLNNLKLRASYAEMGSQSGIANYDGYQFYNLVSTGGAYVGSDLLTYIKTNGQFASTTRQWERIKNYNVALDFGLFGGSLNGTVEAFLKKNDNMLVAMTYPAILGDKAPSANSGKFKDWGFEGQITYNGKIGNVNYHVGGNITFARNKLTDYGGTSVLSSGYTSTHQGYSLNSIFGMRYGGKIQTEEQLKAYIAKYYTNNGIGMPNNLRIGDNMYCDENGDGVLNYKDYIYLGSDTPEISYSFNVGASWKGFDINVVFQGSANRFVYRGVDSWTVPFRSLYTNTTTSSIGNTWSTDNPNAYYCPYTTDSNIVTYDYQASSLTAQDGRYIRLKDLTIGYTFPTSLLRSIKAVQSARVYFTGSDLWESTKISDGWDPETKLSASGVQRYPFTRNFTFGLNLTF
jgi:TonB-linked SusC/RagA family outer membrane protein